MPMVAAAKENKISFDCPGCRKTLRAPRTMVGKRTSCPGCGTTFQVPLDLEPVREVASRTPTPAPRPYTPDPIRRRPRRTPLRSRSGLMDALLTPRAVLGGLVLLAILIGVIYTAVRDAERAKKETPFSAALSEYLSLDPGKHKGELGGTVAVSGKLVIVDREAGKVDPIYHELPPELLAAGPSEVGAVVWVEWHQIKVGYYKGTGGGAYRVDCTVTVFDKAKGSLVARKRFAGGAPPLVIHGSQREGTGSKPTSQIMKYLAGLVRA